MKKETRAYIQLLKERFAERQRKNGQYSLRSFARDLGIHHSALSLILRGKRGIPKKNLLSVIKSLELSPVEELAFLADHRQHQIREDHLQLHYGLAETLEEEKHYRVISEWEYAAVIELMDTQGFKWDVDYIGKKLEIPFARAQVVMDKLIEVGVVCNNSFQKLSVNLKTSDGVESKAIRKSHKEGLELSLSKIDEGDFDLKNFSSVTMAIDAEDMNEYVELIRDFRKKVIALSNRKNKKDVYQLGIQFFPLTHEGEHHV